MWQQPAQRLPIRVRPVRGETVISYVFRLANANDLARPTILLGALGRPTAGLTRSLLNHHDVRLNEPALQRLATFGATPEHRLKEVMPSLHRFGEGLPPDIPAIRPVKVWNLNDHCTRCSSQLPGQPTIRIYTLFFPRLCRRHHRWLVGDIDLAGTPEIITAHRRYGRMLVKSGDRQWAYQQLQRASWIVQEWARRSHREIPRLHIRWEARAKTLGGNLNPSNPSALLVYPEAVALAEILSDLHWRRHIAMAAEHEMTDFFHHVAKRLNQPPDFARWLKLPWLFFRLSTRPRHPATNPLNLWMAEVRLDHEQIRTAFYRQHGALTDAPLPEIRHFK